MINIHKNYSLKPYNTFGIHAKTAVFAEYSKPQDVRELIDQGLLNTATKLLVLGGGSNLLFTANFDGLIIHPINTDVSTIEETEDHVFLKAGAGLNWDDFVEFTVNKDLGGLENLSHIPGNVGAAPVQNIGAYGVEAKDCIHAVNLVSLNDGTMLTLTNKQCEFGYRNSIFKSKLKDQYLVDSVVFKLAKDAVLNTAYGSLKEELEKESKIDLKSVRRVIIRVRESKLPNPDEIGNGGSFFKNPVITAEKAEALLKEFPDMVSYSLANNKTKLAAGWLIEHAGLKGYTNEKGSAGVHHKQALVLINKNNATGNEIVDLSQHIQASIATKFGIHLEPEVIFI